MIMTNTKKQSHILYQHLQHPDILSKNYLLNEVSFQRKPARSENKMEEEEKSPSSVPFVTLWTELNWTSASLRMRRDHQDRKQE